MKNLKKKGFTIVELVIVIAVIAVLAAVLIPTFVNLTKKANLSADQQAVRQMNVALATKEADTIKEAVDVLDKAGYNALDTLTPVSTGYSFWWVEEYNSIVLLNEKAEVVFASNNDAKENFVAAKEAGKAFNLKRGLPEVPADDSESVIKALQNGQSIKLEGDATEIVVKNQVVINSGEDVIIDLNGKTLKADWETDDQVKHNYALENYGTLTIKNGTIEARGIKTYGDLTIEEGVTIVALDNDGGQCINAKAGTVTINGGTFEVAGGGDEEDLDSTSEPAAMKVTSAKVTINGGTFKSEKTFQALVTVEGNSAELVINGGTFDGSRGVVSVLNGNVIINNGSFKDNSTNSYVIYAAGGTVKISGGTFTASNKTYCSASTGTGVITLANGTELTAGQIE